MNRSIAALAATAGLLVFAAPAFAGEGLPTDSTPTTTTTTTVPTTSTPTTTTTTSVPVTTSVPTTTSTDPCVVDCIPNDPPIGDPCIGADCVPGNPIGSGGVPTSYGAGGLPFTGIEDLVLPILLGLVVLLGGVVAWRWAQLREAVAEAAGRARRLPAQDARTAYQAATRQLHIEHRARQVFMPRVA